MIHLSPTRRGDQATVCGALHDNVARLPLSLPLSSSSPPALLLVLLSLWGGAGRFNVR